MRLIMSNNIYEEAIADAKILKDAAEERAKKKLIESMSPKIKMLIENSILNDDEDNITAEEDVYEGEACESDLYEEEACESDLDEGDEPLEDDEHIGRSNNEDYQIQGESIRVINRLMTHSLKKEKLEEKLFEIRDNIKKLKRAFVLSESRAFPVVKKQKIDKILNTLNDEILNLKENSIINSDRKLLETYLGINKEIKNMSRRRSNTKINESLEDLLEIDLLEDDEEEEGAVKDDDFEGEGEPTEGIDDDFEFDLKGESDSIPTEDVANAVENLIAELDLDLAGIPGGDDEEPDDEEPDDEEPDDDEDEIEKELEESFRRMFESPELDEDEDINFETDGMELDGFLDEADNEEDLEGLDLSDGEEDIIEIDESMLRREIGRMKKLREGNAVQMASHFGGGKAGKDMFADVDSGILNALSDELGDAPRPTLKKEAVLRNTKRKNRLLMKSLKEHKVAVRKMKKQLSEMNLFNAKLLYANKLMQNRELSIKQQKHIVESLDNASTLNEAKLLFESLSSSLTRTGRNLSEGSSRKIFGSSSKAVGRSQGSNTVELDRWATLAGLKK
jgi:hypothetical protein